MRFTPFPGRAGWAHDHRLAGTAPRTRQFRSSRQKAEDGGGPPRPAVAQAAAAELEPRQQQWQPQDAEQQVQHGPSALPARPHQPFALTGGPSCGPQCTMVILKRTCTLACGKARAQS